MTIGAVLVAGVAACSPSASAPSGEGLCWRMFEEGAAEPRFEIVGREVLNLESCAVLLEGARLMEGVPTTGAYNGHFIFASEGQISSATSIEGARIRVFEPEDRRKVQEGLRALIEQRRSDPPSAS